jgi:UDP-glucose 4-epimerase
MSILITGGAGFIGSHLAERFVAMGEEVYVIDDLSTGSIGNISILLRNPHFHFYEGSVLDKSLVGSMVMRCDKIVHLAASVGVKRILDRPLDSIEINVYGTENVLSACNRSKKRVLIASSSEVYGKNCVEKNLHEDDCALIGPTNVHRWSYACTKLLGEFMALAYHRSNNLPVTIMRFFNVIGTRQVSNYGMVVPNFVKMALSDQPIIVHGDGMQTRTFVNVRDVVDAIVLIMDRNGTGDIYNIGGDREISIGELAHLVKNLTLSNSSIINAEYSEVYGPHFEDMRRRVPDISRIKEAIGYRPSVSLEETILEITNWLRQKETSELKISKADIAH